MSKGFMYLVAIMDWFSGYVCSLLGNFTTGHILTSPRRREGDRYGETFIQ